MDSKDIIEALKKGIDVKAIEIDGKKGIAISIRGLNSEFEKASEENDRNQEELKQLLQQHFTGGEIDDWLVVGTYKGGETGFSAVVGKGSNLAGALIGAMEADRDLSRLIVTAVKTFVEKDLKLK